ncbi:MAG: iron-sulfur cluster assembly scaffold protein [Deltaproteobacteria bacterium]|nr:iron-sulfur cluster assembly scaffold protein [Deltaproteobacteria bacterium]
MLLNRIVGFVVIITIIAGWFAIYYFRNSPVQNPNGKARVTGTCGDTMEIFLEFSHNRVSDSSCWSNGCAYSLNCAYAATNLALGKSPEEIFNIDADLVQRSIGGLPKDHMHCANLAVDTLYSAVDDYMR